MKAQLFDFLYAFPTPLFGQIGKLTRLKRDTHSVGGTAWREDPLGMPDPELRLCNDYYAAFGENIASKPVFENAHAYLVNSYQSDTRPMALWQHALLLALTLAEAAGTGFLLAPWVSQEMSAAQISYIGWIIAFAFAFGMLILTHFAGRSYKKAALFKNIAGKKDPDALEHVRPVSLSMAQDADAQQKPEIRFVARISKGPRDRGSLWPTFATIVVLGAALAFIFYIRWEGIKEAETHQVVQLEHHGVSSSSSNPFAAMSSGNSASLPPAIQQAEQQARDRVAKEIAREHAGQGFGAAVLLSFIYIMTQSAGFLFAYQHAFLGDGEQAFRLTRGESHHETYIRAVASPYLNRAESRLAELRQSLIEHIPEYAQYPSRVSFMAFYHRRQGEKLRQESLAGLIQEAEAPRPTTTSGTPRSSSATTAAAAGPIGMTDEELRAAAQEIYALGDAAARKVRFRERSTGLDSAEQMKLLDYFNQIKDEHARVQTLAEDLFKD
ncbi:MAG: hypothetical protein M0038_06900 [Pseudomonadota bacterium]|jgi:hypothetical protein|nr:hypothetical protein [Pseudomonadota bacterium]